MATNLTGEMIGTWQVTCDAVQPDLPELPHVVEYHSELTGFIEEGKRLQVQQKGLMAELQSVNRRRREVADVGDQLRLRIGAALQAKHGFKNEKLISFGVKPRRRSRRRSEEQPPEPPASSTQSDSQ